MAFFESPRTRSSDSSNFLFSYACPFTAILGNLDEPSMFSGPPTDVDPARVRAGWLRGGTSPLQCELTLGTLPKSCL